MAVARDKRGSNEHVVALCGDAAFTCGITMEALNNVASSTDRLIIILNDNKWSIAKNVGALSRYFNELITNPIYNRLNDNVESILQKVLKGVESLIEFGSKWKQETKDFFVSSSLFEGTRFIISGRSTSTTKSGSITIFAPSVPTTCSAPCPDDKGQGYNVAIKNLSDSRRQSVRN